MSWASLVNNDQLRVLLWIQDVTGPLSFSCPLVHVQYSAVLADDWGTFRSTCPIYLQRCLVKCADPKKKIIQDPPPPPSSERQISLQGRRGVRGLVPLFYFANLISLYFLRGGGVRPPYPPLDPRMGIDGTQVVLIIYPQQVSIHSFIWILYFIILYHLKKS